ncbi:hypothetical protein NQ314_015194 [Rhamnusium bicolor]|uniref:Uncharacterized protein n=1 Tax=Rhamnusium bicolor TaxID=1586634 RepID=A0AAV8WZZ0_9CUCU|nr:hypothetical protein NQ314_015194 [Rhamnusium bicolor]
MNLKNKKRKLKKNKENEETTDEEEWKSEASGSGDEDVDWAGVANPDNFKELERDPKKDDFVLVALVDEANGRSKEKFYIAKIVTQGEIREWGVSFLRKSEKKTGSFVFPLIEDIATINSEDIKLILPPPSFAGGTKRLQSFLKFDIDFLLLNMG